MFALTPFEKKMNRMMRNPFEEMFNSNFFPETFKFQDDFKTDIQDLGDSYLLEADLPGFDKENIRAEIKDHRLIISAKREAKEEKKDEKNGYICRERSYGEFCRSFDLDGIDENGINGSYTDGVLKLTLPKSTKPEEETKKIEIA